MLSRYLLKERYKQTVTENEKLYQKITAANPEARHAITYQSLSLLQFELTGSLGLLPLLQPMNKMAKKTK